MRSPLVSIGIPVYNVELYIEKCLISILKQTLTNFEVICIDDGSTDFTSGILNSFSKIDTRFRVITQGNKGLSAARNKGLSQARGEYISFIDSDDWVDTNFLESLYTAIKENSCDIAATNIVRKRKFIQKYRVHYTQEIVYNDLEKKMRACKIPKCCYVWNKLYKKSIITK